uniref:Uncharacterized protein n=1 Tax=mine drainage metagenome TaxID=410659 RepID=E6QKP5_9ZZZZ
MIPLPSNSIQPGRLETELNLTSSYKKYPTFCQKIPLNSTDKFSASLTVKNGLTSICYKSGLSRRDASKSILVDVLNQEDHIQ